MRVLITNNTLSQRAGTELYVRDVASRLRELGHEVVAFSTQLGPVAEELLAAGVAVVDDLEKLPFQPDIIHGQHHRETMMALLSLPGVPAVYFCHGAVPWEEMPPVFPRIVRYAAVDSACRNRVVQDAGVPADAVRVLLNFVDLQRFERREPLPTKPGHALVFSNYASETNCVGITRQACACFQISVDVAGIGSNQVAAAPEKILSRYDLVFAKGRAALEAMAVGAAVVACDTHGCGPLVRPENFEELRQLNFGFRVMSLPMTVENLSAQIAQYDPAAAAAVCQRVRAEADMRAVVNDIVQLYEEVLAEYKHRPVDPVAELRAAGNYLQSIRRLVQPTPKEPEPIVRKGFSEQLARKADKLARWLRKR